MRSLFTSERWFSVLENGFGVRSSVLSFSDGSMLPFSCRRIGFVKIYGSPLPGTFTNIMRPTLVQGKENDLIGYWSRFIKFKFAAAVVKNVDFNSNPEKLPDNVSMFVTRGAIIRYGKFKEDLSYLPQKTRNIVRKGISRNTIHVATLQNARTLIDLHYKNLIFTFSKRGMKVPHPKAAFDAIVENLSVGEDYHLIVAFDDSGVLASSALFLKDIDTLYFHSGGNSIAGLNSGASSALQMLGQKIAHENCLNYDFGGLGISGIDKFKLSFDPQIYFINNYLIGNILFRKLLFWRLTRGI